MKPKHSDCVMPAVRSSVAELMAASSILSRMAAGIESSGSSLVALENLQCGRSLPVEPPGGSLSEACMKELSGGIDSLARETLPFVSIVIPAYNAAHTIRLCLDAIQQSDYPKEQYEVIVVDNNSTDDTPAIVSQYPVKLRFEREIQGPHAATNTGVRQAKGEIIVFTDSDCVPEPRWLRTLVDAFVDEEVIAAGGKIEAHQPRTRIEWFLQEEVNLFRNCVRLTESFPASVITGNAAYRASALRQVGLFNANLYTGAEVDLAWRVQWTTGKKVVYVPMLSSITYSAPRCGACSGTFGFMATLKFC